MTIGADLFGHRSRLYLNHGHLTGAKSIAIDQHSLRIIAISRQQLTRKARNLPPHATVFATRYSHSIVPGGLLVTS
jgi:hypothetical protein